jgi:outer membrane protein OmpA-like peptidoglycan-associated protein
VVANTSDAGNSSPTVAGAQASVPSAAPVSAPEPAPARPSLSLSIQFDFDSSRIRPESLVALGNLATALGSAALLPSRFVIEGHTDAKGSADYNRKLSDQRAAAVKDLLVAKGIAGARLLSVGKGSSELANPAAPQAAENRRVKIVNLD